MNFLAKKNIKIKSLKFMTPLRIAVFGCREFEHSFLHKHHLTFTEIKFIKKNLNIDTVELAGEAEVISIFSKDIASAEVLEELYKQGTRMIALRSAGFNNVNLEKAKALGIKVARVPAYSPEAIAEHTIALILAISRQLIRADKQIHQFNFSLDGMLGFNLKDQTVGIIGTGNIGAATIRILNGFGCRILAHDLYPNLALVEKYQIEYVGLDQLIFNSDIISLHIPLNDETTYLIDWEQIEKMKNGVILINTSRGKHINTKDLIKGIETKKIKAVGLDVYENEVSYFFEDHSTEYIEDELLKKLLSYDNVLLTGHQAFFTHTAINNIAKITFDNIHNYHLGIKTDNFLV